MTEYKKFKPSNNIGLGEEYNEYNFFAERNSEETKVEKPSLLLHSCCGPCSTSVIERLIREYKITIFFYNPNITDEEEYLKRKETQLKFIERYNQSIDKIDVVSFLEGPYDREVFRELSCGLEKEPEGGIRCTECFRLRLEITAETAKMWGNDIFGTTLTVSPHKNFAIINKIGLDLAIKYGLTYLAEDFKKKAGYQRSIEMSKDYGLYRQQFCGCDYSKKEEIKE
ncbi:MAG TPA: epoxyqueuosine reductase QueH [Anaerovoracaceae bacterium]|nr:epoxyqueuosine reductase QueH [Anaerovoracaceae bacterium]